MRIKADNLKDLLIAEEEAVDEAVRRAMRDVLLTHKRAGKSVASWRDGEVVIIPAEEIVVEEASAESERSRKD